MIRVKWLTPFPPPLKTECLNTENFLGIQRTRFLQPETRRAGVRVEHFHGIQRELLEVFSQERNFPDEVVRHRDDMASDGVCLNEIQNLPWARPD